MDSAASTAQAAPSQLPRRTPAKSVSSACLPSSIALSHCEDLVDVSSLGKVETLTLAESLQRHR
eukprot:CAMPEP_0177677426 /NCGR_PEP_ID=MMETSP0447-20121125/28387_1 /TAXON_ID=0 /ORGANISM="Stygamoeba regulata, Strain BSH-02190019" /LENGTH=63 /DNA_ID=CAMNT_0019186197 /DNA_START=251 /DNA_END=442 /DNA_ORIENTATION=+